MPEPGKFKSYPEQLRLVGLLTGPLARQAISALNLPGGGVGLDAGCGLGTHSQMLAVEVGPTGKVIGVDISSENLRQARRAARAQGLSKRVEFLRHDFQRLPFATASLDWAWCADALWPVPGIDPWAAIREFRRVLKPAGRIGILFWATQVLLPGFPALEARLNLAYVLNNPYLNPLSPSLHYLRAHEWLRQAGFVDIDTKSFVAEVRGPLSADRRMAVAYCLSMFWGNLKKHLSAQDWTMFQNLCDPKCSDCIYDNPDYCALIVYSLFQARVPVQGNDKRDDRLKY